MASVLCLFLMVPCIGLQCVVVPFPGHAPLLSKVYSVLCLFHMVLCIDLQCLVVASPGPTHYFLKYIVFYVSSSWCRALIYSVWLWHFLVILIYFLKCISR